ncbi:Neuraminidase [Pseudomonas syringae pv. actinidiae]|uniref:Neuraminidase n=1 Tax=Pseudomonas syringae pv. actinidiae TaxID=103796 RepID=A0A2V0QBX8_PSESF|nr:Neuraminidase [Pseudomonas syringae pv. actinidiae]
MPDCLRMQVSSAPSFRGTSQPRKPLQRLNSGIHRLSMAWAIRLIPLPSYWSA